MKKKSLVILALIAVSFHVYSQTTGTDTEQRLTNSDGSYARFIRSISLSNNRFAGKNQVVQFGNAGRALQFNGINQYFTGSDAGLPTGSSVNMTVSFWLNTSQSTHTVILNYGAGAGQFQIYVDASLGAVGSWANVNLGYTSCGKNLADGKWHHYVFALNNNTAMIYIDGAGYNCGLSTAYNIALNGVLCNNVIGADAPGYASGSLDQLLIYNRTLSTTSGPNSSNEIAQLYNGGSATAEIPTGAIRRYEFEEGTGAITNDINASGTQYPLALANEDNATSWVDGGVAPLPPTPNEVTFFSSSDGTTNAERGIATWGDLNGRDQQQGKWFQWFQGAYYPLVSNNQGGWLFNPSNTSASLPTVASTIDVAGNISIGSAYAGINAAPANGLLVQGSVGIGTPAPGNYQLAVNGNIHSKAVVVDLSGFPDYVFKPGYQLMPLTEVEAFIDRNYHLPDMPSEKEVTAKGADLGEMNKLLVKKVEELTLYLIEQNKRIQQLEHQLNSNK